jgi:glycosyltransferase involved in cell wall biosynthesis
LNRNDQEMARQSMTRVSIVTISFNQAEFLERTIESVLTQDYPEIEYIVVDPGSTDGSREIIDRYRSRISKLVLGPDRGAANGLNHGFAEATGEILGFLNSDDLLLPKAVSAAVSFLQKHQNIGVVSGHSKLIDPDDRILRDLYSDRMSVNRCIYGAVFLIQPSTFFRRSFFEQVGGFREESKACWDGELFLEMARAGAKFAIVDEFWSAYRIHPNSVTGSKSSEARVIQTQAKIFSRVKGRQPSGYDKLLTRWYRLLRHILNPLDTWERIRRGPVFARTLDN